MEFQGLIPILGFGQGKSHLFSVVSFSSVTLLLIITKVQLVSSIVIPDELESLVEDHEDAINLETRETYAHMRDLTRTIPCVVTFIESYLDIQPTRIPVLVPENTVDSMEIAQLYLSALHDVKPIFVLSGHLVPTDDHITSLTALIITRDLELLSASTTQYIDLCGRDCRYLVTLTAPFADEKTFLEDVNKMITVMWDRRIANVVFLGSVGQRFLAAKSLSFQSNKTSEPSIPEVVAECHDDGNWTDTENGFVDMYAPLQFNGCIIHVAFFEYEPYVSMKTIYVESFVASALSKVVMENVTSSENDTSMPDNVTSTGFIEIKHLIGIEAQLIKSLASSLNFVIKEKEIPWDNGSTVADEVNEALWGKGNDDVDMVLGGLPWAPKNETDYTLPYEVVQIVWVIPIHIHVSLQGLVSPLEDKVWFAVIGLLVFAASIEMILTRNVSFLEIFSLVLGVSWPQQPTILSSRIRFISWVIFGYVLTQCYLASLSGQLMASSSQQIESLQELADSWLTPGGTAETKELFNDPHGADDTIDVGNEINRKMMSKFQVFEHEEYAKHFDDLINERSHDLALAVTMNISSMKPSFEGKHVHRMREALSSFPLSFAVWRGMPYLSVLDKKISSLTETGIISHWARKISLLQGGYYDTELHDDEVNLRLSALAPGFLLLIMGYGAAGTALLLEIAIFRWMNRKTASTKPKTKKKIGLDKVKDSSIAFNVVRKEGSKLPDTLDARAWIMRFNDLQRNGTGRHHRAIRRINYPFEFVN